MTLFKTLLIIVLVALTIAVSVAGYLFYKLNGLKQTSLGAVPTVSTTSMSGGSDTVVTDEPVQAGEFTVPATGFVIQIDTLPESQQSAARAMGFEDQIVITPETITCAAGRIGQERVDAIADGAAPTFMESVALLGCI